MRGRSGDPMNAITEAVPIAEWRSKHEKFVVARERANAASSKKKGSPMKYFRVSLDREDDWIVKAKDERSAIAETERKTGMKVTGIRPSTKAAYADVIEYEPPRKSSSSSGDRRGTNHKHPPGPRRCPKCGV